MKITDNRYDVVVIGNGGAGLRAAISAAEGGARTLIVAKGKINRSGCTLLAGANLSADIACDGGSLAEMGISDANKDDTPEQWFRDTVYEGFYLGNQELIQVFVDEAAGCVRELMGWGMEVLGTEGERGIAVFGSAILDALFKRVRELRIDYIEDTACADLVTDGGRIAGVVLINVLTGEIRFTAAKAVVMATGGSHNLFSENSGPTDCCGEGQAMALRAGAELVDMEMISFCPAVIKEPLMYKGNILPYIINTTGFGTMLNKFGKPFTDRHLSRRVELLALETEWNKMLLSYAIQREIDEGRGNRYGGVYYTLKTRPKELLDELYAQFPSLDKGIYSDIMAYILDGHALTVAPFAHYFEGGIRIDREMQTRLPGLFAAGECAGGLFGANRVSAATTEMLTEGKVAGASAARYAAGQTAAVTEKSALEEAELRLTAPFAGKGDESIIRLRDELRTAMQTAMHITRREETLAAAEDQIQQLKERLAHVSIRSCDRTYNKQWMDYLQVQNGLLTASAMLRSARLRKESRGVHIREDYFFTDNGRFLNNIVIQDPSLTYRLEKPVVTRVQPEDALCHDYVDYIEETVRKLS